MELTKIKIDQINPASYNPRKALGPGDPAFDKLKNSIETFGYLEPVIWNKTTGNIVGGHQRTAVMKTLGYTEIDCVVVEMDELEEKELNLALNKIDGGWDEAKLNELLQEIQGAGAIEMTGFDVKEVERLATKMAAMDLAAALAAEAEVEQARDTANDLAENYAAKIRAIAAQHPERMSKAIGVVVSKTTGGEVLILVDCAATDFIAELRRYADAGAFSPLERILGEVVPMKWT